MFERLPVFHVLGVSNREKYFIFNFSRDLRATVMMFLASTV